MEERKFEIRLSGSEFNLETLIFLEELETPCFSMDGVQKRVALKASLYRALITLYRIGFTVVLK